MTGPQLVIAGMILVMWLLVLNVFRLRNWRAASLAGVSTALIVAGYLLPWPIDGIGQASVWTIVLLVFLVRSDLVGVLSPAEYKFLEAYVGAMREMRRLKTRVRETDPGEYLARFQEIVRTIQELDVPREWRRVHKTTVEELRRRETRMALLAMPTAEEQQILASRWLELEKDFDRLVKARAGFWAGWPLHSHVGRA